MRPAPGPAQLSHFPMMGAVVHSSTVIFISGVSTRFVAAVAALFAFSVASRAAAARVLITDTVFCLGFFLGRLRDLSTTVQLVPPYVSVGLASLGPPYDSGAARWGVIDGEASWWRFLASPGGVEGGVDVEARGDGVLCSVDGTASCGTLVISAVLVDGIVLCFSSSSLKDCRRREANLVCCDLHWLASADANVRCSCFLLEFLSERRGLVLVTPRFFEICFCVGD